MSSADAHAKPHRSCPGPGRRRGARICHEPRAHARGRGLHPGGRGAGSLGTGPDRDIGFHRDFGRSGRIDAALHHRHGDAAAILPQVAAPGAGRHRADHSCHRLFGDLVHLLCAWRSAGRRGDRRHALHLFDRGGDEDDGRRRREGQHRRPSGARHPVGAGSGRGAFAADHRRPGRAFLAAGHGSDRGQTGAGAGASGRVHRRSRQGEELPFSLVRISAEGFRHRHVGRIGNLFHRRGGLGPSGPVTRAGRVSGRTGGGALHAAGAARSPWRSRFKASFCSCSSCRWDF